LQFGKEIQMTTTTEQTTRKSRGFASMSIEKQREIARKGGKAAHERGTAHQFTSDEARAAGRKGGERVSVNRQHMAAIGRLGGRSSAGRRAATPADAAPAEANAIDSTADQAVTREKQSAEFQ
jgi:hypothetical protein